MVARRDPMSFDCILLKLSTMLDRRELPTSCEALGMLSGCWVTARWSSEKLKHDILLRQSLDLNPLPVQENRVGGALD